MKWLKVLKNHYVSILNYPISQYSLMSQHCQEMKHYFLTYVRFIKGEIICLELLFAKTLETDTNGDSIFHILEKFFKEKEIPLSNILSVATDGAHKR